MAESKPTDVILLREREAIPKLIGKVNGKWEGILTKEWITAVKSYFESEKIVDETVKIKKARSFISYEKGSAGQLVTDAVFDTFKELTEFLQQWLDAPRVSATDIFEEVMTIKWHAKTEGYEIFITRVMKAVKAAEAAKFFGDYAFYTLAMGVIGMNMPCKELKKKMDKLIVETKEIKSWKDFQKFLGATKTIVNQTKDADIRKNLGLAELTEGREEVFQIKSNATSDRKPQYCYNCGKPNHFSRNCSYCKHCDTYNHHTFQCRKNSGNNRNFSNTGKNPGKSAGNSTPNNYNNSKTDNNNRYGNSKIDNSNNREMGHSRNDHSNNRYKNNYNDTQKKYQNYTGRVDEVKAKRNIMTPQDFKRKAKVNVVDNDDNSDYEYEEKESGHFLG